MFAIPIQFRPFRFPRVATAALLMACLLVSAPLFADDSAKQTNGGEPVEIKIIQKHVSLQIENPNHHAGELFHVSKHETTKVADINPDPAMQTFIVPSGIYMVRDLESKVDFPAPALFEAEAPEFKTIIVMNEVAREDEQWCWIPAGPALIGDSLGVGASDERLSIQNLDGFWMARTEVKNEQYADFLNSQKEIEDNWIDLESKKCLIERGTSKQYVVHKPHLPVVMVSLYGAQAYCDWLTETTGQKHRLPTEVEWEKAARGTCSYVYSYGNVYNESGGNQQSGYLTRVGRFPANSYGLFDMTGNVFEWMSNQYDPTQPTKVMNQSLRGGSFVLDGMYLRNSFRMRQSPSVMTDDIGFRVVREAITENKVQQQGSK